MWYNIAPQHMPGVGYLKRDCNINKNDFEIIEVADTHGGFHGDGEYYIILDCKNNKEKALKAVCLDQEVENMQAGMDTKIGDKGSGLSGGQMERLALARTLVHQKSVMVLDDPFSALDVKTEKEVFANLRNLCKDSIVILISHRLALFPQCDQVVWFENGTALTSTHEALLKENKQYAEVFALSNVSPEADHETE